MVKNPPAMQTLQVGSLSWEDPPEEEMATHSGTFARIIPWTVYSSGQNTGVGKPFRSPRDLPNTGIEPRSPTLQVGSLPAEPQGKPDVGEREGKFYTIAE